MPRSSKMANLFLVAIVGSVLLVACAVYWKSVRPRLMGDQTGSQVPPYYGHIVWEDVGGARCFYRSTEPTRISCVGINAIYVHP